MKLKIVSDGTFLGTKVINLETGEELEDITKINWQISFPYGAEILLGLSNIPVEVIGDIKTENEKEY